MTSALPAYRTPAASTASLTQDGGGTPVCPEDEEAYPERGLTEASIRSTTASQLR